MIVYKIVNKINGRIYVGITTQKLESRMNNHFSLKHKGAPLLKKAIAKYGKDNFEYSVVEMTKTMEELGQREVFWIKELRSLCPKGYNMLAGGLTNTMAIESLKTKVVRADTGKIFSSLTEAAAMTGASRHSIGFSCVGRQNFAKKIPFRYLDKDLFEKGEKVRKIRAIKKDNQYLKVLCVETQEVFDTAVQAAKAKNMSINSVRGCLYDSSRVAKGFSFKHIKKGDI